MCPFRENNSVCFMPSGNRCPLVEPLLRLDDFSPGCRKFSFGATALEDFFRAPYKVLEMTLGTPGARSLILYSLFLEPTLEGLIRLDRNERGDFESLTAFFIL